MDFEVTALTVAAPTVPGLQYYFETIFPRIPKPVGDDLSSRLAAVGLPSKTVGNAGQGGADRRGVEDGSRRPASVKVRSAAPGDVPRIRPETSVGHHTLYSNTDSVLTRRNVHAPMSIVMDKASLSLTSYTV